MAGPEDRSSDYGYDLAHEVKTYLADTPVRHQPQSTTDLHREPEPDSDFGYDSVHDF
ncbi:MAG TPA: hypothetical protein VNO83_11660 [Pseudonocardia sp.]|jgi:hypothetical protein|nr:hypothetical protein [Pseudonocardia sp.]